MVEPLSLALISGAAGLGMVLGRFTKSNRMEYASTEPEEQKLLFMAVQDVVDPQEIVEAAREGNPVFVNVKPLIKTPEKLYKFLQNLSDRAMQHKLLLSQISNDLLLLSANQEPIHVRTLKRIASREINELDEIAGY